MIEMNKQDGGKSKKKGNGFEAMNLRYEVNRGIAKMGFRVSFTKEHKKYMPLRLGSHNNYDRVLTQNHTFLVFSNTIYNNLSIPHGLMTIHMFTDTNSSPKKISS